MSTPQDSQPGSSTAFASIVVGAQVEILGEPGTFLVAAVDPIRYTADVLPLRPRAVVELGVHFSAIRAL